MSFSLIAAVDKKRGIGKEGKLPWHLPTDLKYFNDVTTGKGKNVVIMGRLTFESIPAKQKPLKNRINMVITRNEAYKVPAGVECAVSLEQGLVRASAHHPEEIFVIGGAQIFTDAIRHPECTTIYLTEIESVFDCDTFFPKVDKNIFKKASESQVHEENGVRFRFIVYKK